MSDTTIDRARALLILRESVRCADAVSMCNQMGDVVQELLAEVERLTSDRRTLQAAGEHPAPCARHCESTAYEIELRQLRARAEAAECRLRELASAEPVAWGLEAEIDGKGWAVQLPVCPTREDAERDRQLYGHPASLRTVALIRRPEMPS